MKQISKSLMWVTLMRSQIEDRIDDLKEVIEMSEYHLGKEIELLTKRVNAELENLEEDEREFTIGWYTDDFIRLDEVYPNIQRRALFTAIMSMTEANLLFVCEMCFRAYRLPRSFKKKRDNQRLIVQAISYLQEQLTIRKTPLKTYWETIQQLWTIRNVLVHSDGKVNTQKLKEVTDFCLSIPSLELDKHNRLILHKGFVNMAIHEVSLFFSRFLDEIKRNKLPN
jgi:hypothetical protein